MLQNLKLAAGPAVFAPTPAPALLEGGIVRNRGLPRGLQRRKWGIYVAEIQDLFEVRVWLGTYNTVEEVDLAYENKKKEFERLILLIVIIDAKSGVSGAGRRAKEHLLFTEVAEGINSYGVARHRYVPETEQGLSDAARSRVTISFTPHLIPMIRGMQSTIYVEMVPGVRIEDLHQQLSQFYKDEEFIRVLEDGVISRTHRVRGTNYCLIKSKI